MSKKNPDNVRLLLCDACGRKAENQTQNSRIVEYTRARSDLSLQLQKVLYQMDALNQHGAQIEQQRNELVIFLGLMLRDLGSFRLRARDIEAIMRGDAQPPRFRRDLQDALVITDGDAQDLVLTYVEPQVPQPTLSSEQQRMRAYYLAHDDAPPMIMLTEMAEESGMEHTETDAGISTVTREQFLSWSEKFVEAT